MRVILSETAQADLRAVARWIAIDNPPRAKSFAAELQLACQSLGTKPRRFPVVYEGDAGEIRKHIHGNYLILYRVSAAAVEIVRIVHGSRDWAVLLRD